MHDRLLSGHVVLLNVVLAPRTPPLAYWFGEAPPLLTAVELRLRQLVHNAPPFGLKNRTVSNNTTVLPLHLICPVGSTHFAFCDITRVTRLKRFASFSVGL